MPSSPRGGHQSILADKERMMSDQHHEPAARPRLSAQLLQSARARRTLFALPLVCLVAVMLSLIPPQASGWQILDADTARRRMVDEEIVGAGIKNPRVIEAIRSTVRHEFVPAAERRNAYLDMALPIGDRQTISPPFVVAYMTEQIDPQPTDKVLEIGTGSGYQAAVLSPLVAEVYSIEIVESLGKRAARTLTRLGYKNVYTKVGDGYQGWPEHAPFDKIIVTCSPENVPQALVDQLREGGRMIVPLGERYQQTLYLFRKEQGKLVSEALLPTLFVPMTGAAEEERRVQPDPLNPQLYNGSFEELIGDTSKPRGWHYQRQLTPTESGKIPEGQRAITFANRERGLGAQALQGFPVDGRQVPELEISLWVRGQDLARGQTADQMPLMAITFYDDLRATVGRVFIGPWQGTFDWREITVRERVPPKAREAIVHIGLFGATGELSVDDIRVRAVRPGK